VTGFPGFIGKRLVRALLADDPKARIAALVEPRMSATAATAAAEIDGDRVEIVAGDIGEPRLGLADAEYERLAGSTAIVHHLAAIYDLGVPLEIAQRVNVDGTGNVLEFCRACDELTRLNYVSTAYVAGDRTGVVYEHELALGQAFKNHYESTKFQAEVWVRDAMAAVPTTIFRPAIVVGDSRTGETQKFDGPYYALRFIASSVSHGMPVANIGRGGAPFNVVPVDFIVDALVSLGKAPEAIGHTLHLCDPDPLGARELFELLSELYAGKRPAYRVAPGLVRGALRYGPVRRYFGGSPPQSIRYLNHPVRYDTRQATALLASAGLRCPRFPEYAPAMVDFFREHEADEALLGPK
jgi:thioester reductase-like protein